jgi:putative transposase
VTLTGANIHDKWMVGATLDAIAIHGARGPRRPKHLCLDKGYDYDDCRAEARERGVSPHVRRRGEKPLLGCIRGKPRRWVVERTNSWHNNFRGLRIRWERRADRYGALVYLACAIMIVQATRRELHRS